MHFKNEFALPLVLTTRVTYQLIVTVRNGQMQRTGAQVLLALHHVQRQHRVHAQQQPRQLRVHARVAHDQHVQQTLAQPAAVLHLPAGAMVAPAAQRIVHGQRGLNRNGHLAIVHVLPAQVLGPIDRLALAAVVHEHRVLGADDRLGGQRAAGGEGVHQLAAALVVGQPVQGARFRRRCGRLRDDLVEDFARLGGRLALATRPEQLHGAPGCGGRPTANGQCR